MRFKVTHDTTYSYSANVGRCYNLAQMVPRNTDRQNCTRNRISVDPKPAVTNKRADYFGNTAYYFAIQQNHKALTISAESELVMTVARPDIPMDLGQTCEQVLQAMNAAQTPDTRLAREYCLDSPMIRSMGELKEYAAPFFQPDRPMISAVKALNKAIFEDFTYDPGFTTIATPLQDVMLHKRGVCQDFAHFAIGCMRSLGYAARYVSGYLETLPPPGQEKLIGADATHAWFSVYSPDDGWAEFDPTNDKMACEQHIVTAWGRDYSDVTPLRGVIFGGGDDHNLSVAVTVERVEA